MKKKIEVERHPEFINVVAPTKLYCDSFAAINGHVDNIINTYGIEELLAVLNSRFNILATDRPRRKKSADKTA